MAEWILRREQGCCAWLGRGPGKRSERRSRHKAICPNAMRSFWKVAAFRLTDSIRIQSGRRALRCFQNELHHFIILNLKWYESAIVGQRKAGAGLNPQKSWPDWPTLRTPQSRLIRNRTGRCLRAQSPWHCLAQDAKPFLPVKCSLRDSTPQHMAERIAAIRRIACLSFLGYCCKAWR